MKHKARSDIRFLLVNLERQGLPNGLLLHGGAPGLLNLLLHQLKGLLILSLGTRGALSMSAFVSLGRGFHRRYPSRVEIPKPSLAYI